MQLGVRFGDGKAWIKVWAPFAKKVKVKIIERSSEAIDKSLNLVKQGEYWNLETEKLKPGDSYVFILDDEELPDPSSLFQPNGVHKASEAFDLNAYHWNDENWKAPTMNDFIIYELHVGTFSENGDFNGIVEKLDHLVDLGITAIEIMPIAQFPGERNWGYDGVFPFAVQHSYGGPEGFEHLVDSCHQKGLAVILDVVYNHVGPEGNILPKFAPYFTEKHHTPWGLAMNFDDEYSDGVRHFIIDNALMWFKDFHVDALRMDAVHAFKDESSKHILAELRERVDEFNMANSSHKLLIVECDLNDRRYLDSSAHHGFQMDAQWIDEFHHALRVSAGGERNGYFQDFNGLPDLAEAYEHAYVYHGKYSEQRKRHFGSDTTGLEGHKFIAFAQNHDQIGNRMLGERMSQLFSFEMQKLMAVSVMVSPFVPLLFMGEEWAEQQPFQYFVDHSDPQLVEAVRKGRKEEFKDFHQGEDVPDPQAEETFFRSKLNWTCLDKEPSVYMLEFYKDLIDLRRNNPIMKNPDRTFIKASLLENGKMLFLQRKFGLHELSCYLNFSDSHLTLPMEIMEENWEMILDSSAARYGGSSSSSFPMISIHSAQIYYRKNCPSTLHK